MHPGSTKMYHNIKQAYWWNGMKKQITRYVRQCTTCQQVMAEPRKLAGSLQSLETPQWKWDHITMDFVVGLLKTQAENDAILVVVDRLTKTAHFIPIKTNMSLVSLT